MPYLKLQLSHTPLLTILFHGSPALVGLGLLIIEGSWSHSVGVDYTGLLYMVVTSKFISSF